MGLYDAYRLLHPHEPTYSWWDYRGAGFDSGHGLRIDHLLLSAQAVDKLRSCEIVQALRSLERPSDHAPVMCTLEIE
jgi:exodeoxyribonuclease-3